MMQAPCVSLWKEAHAALRRAWPARASFTAAPTAEAAADVAVDRGMDRPTAPPLSHMHAPRTRIPVSYYTSPYSNPHKL